MLAEAIEVMRDLWTGESVTRRGTRFTVENATLHDLPTEPFPLVVSAFGPAAARLAAEKGDGLWTTGTGEDAVQEWRDAGGSGPVWSQLTFCWDPDERAARERAAELWANTAVPGQLSQDLPTSLHFEQGSAHVDADNIAEHTPCGPDPEPIFEAVASAAQAGVDHVYLHQIGHDLGPFLDYWTDSLAEQVRGALR